MGVSVYIKSESCDFIIFGSGKNALRQLKMLAKRGIVPVCVAQSFGESYDQYPCIKIEEAYDKKRIQEHRFIIAAYEDMDLNHRVYEDAKEYGKLCSIPVLVDSDFQLMYTERKADIDFALKTPIYSLSFSKHVFRDLMDHVDEKFYAKLQTYYELQAYVQNLDIPEDEKNEMLSLFGDISDFTEEDQ